MSPYAVKRASYNLAHSIVEMDVDEVTSSGLLWRLRLVTGFEGSTGALLDLAHKIVRVGR